MAGLLRVVIDGPRDPRVNMAIDEAVLRLRKRVGYDTLRIYTWKPTGVSLGRRQDARAAVDLAEAERRGFIVVRRPTGGGALLHADGGEVTYSIVVSDSHPLYSMSIDESASAIARGVVEALRILGVEAGIGGYRGVGEAALCYLRTGSSDVTINGRKVSGSAQLRSHGALLQHGTLLLEFEPSVWSSVIRVDDEGVLGSITSLAGEGLRLPLSRVIRAMVNGFSTALEAEVIYSTLSPEEVEEAIRLYESKYSTREWNLEGG
ncbi:MAG: lipoate--protein ligase family protein [Desulfurococcales archaeon]|nr:lipoate--protein ligase family protein [Desulfurococcales archaeon]